MKEAVEAATGSFFTVLFFVAMVCIQFPGGTILMAVSCNSHDLSGWDWVLSVVIPAFGLVRAGSCAM